MKWLIVILLLWSEANAQMMNGSRFIYSALTAQAPTTYNNAGTQVIRRKYFTNLNTGVNNGNDVYITGTGDLTFIGCRFGPSIRKGVSIENFSGTARFIDCFWDNNEAGIEVETSTGAVQVTRGWVLNPWGQGRCKGQFIQISNSTSSNTFVVGVKGESKRGEGSTEDWVSLFASSGVSGTPIRIANNFFRGGGSSTSGGGIMSGDTDGSWQLIENNNLWRPGNYLYAIASGENITVRNNKAYATNDGLSTIATYCYGGQNGATTCANNEMSGNSVNFWGSNLFYGGDGSPTEDCGDIVGIAADYVANPNTAWAETNNNSLNVSTWAFPTDLFDCVSEDVLYQIRKESVQFYNEEGGCTNAARYHRPTSLAGSDQSISISTVTFSGGSVTSNGATYLWKQVSGPNVATITTPTSAGSTATGLINGVYRFRLVVTDNDGAQDADWMDVTVSGL